MISAQELQDLINAQPPIQPAGRALAFLIVTVVFLLLSTICVGLRIWYRLWKMRRSNIWGWDDILAILGQLCFFGVCAFGILVSFYGTGTPDSELTPFLQLKSAYYYFCLNAFFVCATCFIKTSIGIAIVRISNSRLYTYTICICLVFTNISFFVVFFWVLAQCTPVSARWNPLLGTCSTVSTLPSIYMDSAMAAMMDAICAVVPILILRRLSAPKKTKYALMALLALGGLTVVIAIARVPLIQYLDYNARPHDVLYNTVWIEMTCVIELGIAQIAGSAPTLAKMFHLYDRQGSRNSTSGRTPAQCKNAGASGNAINPLSSDLSHDTSSNLVLVPRSKGECTSRISNGTYDEEAGRQGILQELSFSVLKAQKGWDGQGNFCEIGPQMVKELKNNQGTKSTLVF